ncbi:MAG: ATPase inhibitor subunit zeta [Geminicoccaceae bacterium]
MPTTFRDREQSFEAKFAHDEEFRFRVIARRDKLFAQWAAARLRLSDAAAASLVKAVLAIPDGPSHDPGLLKRVAEAFPQDQRAPEGELLSALELCAQQAREQLLESTPGRYEASPERGGA